MQFKIFFHAPNEHAVQWMQGISNGLNAVDAIRKVYPNTPILEIQPTRELSPLDVSIEVEKEEIIRTIKGFANETCIKVRVPKGSLNKYVYERVSSFDKRLVLEVDQSALLKDWIQDGQPKEWLFPAEPEPESLEAAQ